MNSGVACSIVVSSKYSKCIRAVEIFTVTPWLDCLAEKSVGIYSKYGREKS